MYFMHEIGIANSILDAVRAEVLKRPGWIAHKVAVRIGELSAVDPEALRFAFEALTRETEMQTLQLEIETCPRRLFCANCISDFRTVEFDSCCPRCGQESACCVGGDQLELAYLEMDSYEPSTT
jgi:hydrogenase nickel incorporation protein HypA/HybF